jgi:hypothetical protein
VGQTEDRAGDPVAAVDQAADRVAVVDQASLREKLQRFRPGVRDFRCDNTSHL